MIRILGTTLMAGFLSINPAVARANNDSTDQNRVTVRIWDLTRIENKTIDRAKGAVERVLEPTGVRILWLHCSVGGSRENSACSAPTGPNDISLLIYRRTKADMRIKRHSKGGFSQLLTPEGGKGTIHIFVDRVMEVSRTYNLSSELVLGITMAHEIGHLLLPHEPHALVGVMRAQLNANDWRLAAQDRLGFTGGQNHIILAGVQARIAKARITG